MQSRKRRQVVVVAEAAAAAEERYLMKTYSLKERSNASLDRPISAVNAEVRRNPAEW
jgi:hypothetical protein